MANQMNFVNRGPIIKVVTVLPPVGDVQNGEMYLLISDSATDDKKIHIRIATGWLKSAAFT